MWPSSHVRTTSPVGTYCVIPGDRWVRELVEPRGMSLEGKEQVYDGFWITTLRILQRPHQLFGNF